MDDPTSLTAWLAASTPRSGGADDSPAPLLTVNTVAAWLAVSESTVRRLTRRGELPAIRIGTQLRYRLGAVVDWLERQEVPAAPGADAPAPRPTPAPRRGRPRTGRRAA
jgi:excisionase family DNA binding protein